MNKKFTLLETLDTDEISEIEELWKGLNNIHFKLSIYEEEGFSVFLKSAEPEYLKQAFDEVRKYMSFRNFETYKDEVSFATLPLSKAFKNKLKKLCVSFNYFYKEV